MSTIVNATQQKSIIVYRYCSSSSAESSSRSESTTSSTFCDVPGTFDGGTFSRGTTDTIDPISMLSVYSTSTRGACAKETVNTKLSSSLSSALQSSGFRAKYLLKNR